jgi:predicted ArsR family transcriptional regulator
MRPTSVRFHLDLLVAAGQVTRLPAAPRGRGRPRLLYRIARAPDRPAGPARSSESHGGAMLAEVLAAHMASMPGDVAETSRAAGRSWAENLVDATTGTESPTAAEAIDRVAGVLDHVGFEPTVASAGDGYVIDLHACPFRSVAETHPEVTCSLHLGLVQGAIDRMRAPAWGTSIEPFVTPDLCRLRLGPAAVIPGHA